MKLGLLGARGRMGQWVTKLAENEFASRVKLEVAVNRGEKLESLLTTDAVIDFSASAAFIQLAELALASTKPLPVFVVGSTGWKPQELETIAKLAKKTPTLLSSNFSTGVFALQKILKENAPLFSKLGYTPVLVEAHHQYKKDAPSGTALTLAKALGGDVQMHSIRAGEVIGDHEISFYGAGDKVVLGHFAQDRSIFARGALDAALWMHGKRAELSKEHLLITMEKFLSEL